MKSRMEVSKFETCFNCYPILKELMCLLTHRDVQVLCLTSKYIDHRVSWSLEQRQNINCKLSKFVMDPLGLRSKLRETKGVIAGEFAREYFSGLEPDELQIVLPDGRQDGYGYTKMCILAYYLYLSDGYRLRSGEAGRTEMTVRHRPGFFSYAEQCRCIRVGVRMEDGSN